jgi:hypothetical protein
MYRLTAAGAALARELAAGEDAALLRLRPAG